jgi:RimJ/RimL family protein N-acetyltransferase
MVLTKVESGEVSTVYSWLADPDNNQWLEFDYGDMVSPSKLQSLLNSDTHYVRLFRATPEGDALGIVGLSNINRTLGTAMPWCVLNSDSHAGKFYMIRAISRLLEVAFDEMGLKSLHAWTVETNTPSVRLLKHAGFRYIGRQRRCHMIGGRVLDRLWFDLLDFEYRERMAQSREHACMLADVPPIRSFPRARMDSSVS